MEVETWLACYYVRCVSDVAFALDGGWLTLHSFGVDFGLSAIIGTLIAAILGQSRSLILSSHSETCLVTFHVQRHACRTSGSQAESAFVCTDNNNNPEMMQVPNTEPGKRPLSQAPENTPNATQCNATTPLTTIPAIPNILTTPKQTNSWS